jgi:hypothetical protein
MAVIKGLASDPEARDSRLTHEFCGRGLNQDQMRGTSDAARLVQWFADHIRNDLEVSA